MIELQKHKSFVIEIREFVSRTRGNHGIPLSPNDTQIAQVLNQEKDGSVVYTYDDVSGSGEGALVTHFGLYNPVSKEHQVIHVYSQRVFVASCSVNQEKTLMAFTTMRRDSGSVIADKRTGREKYNAYIAEIKAKSPRVFSLNLERETFLKVQFLYDEKPAEKETYLLVLLHRESIGLYKIPLARVANGMVMRGQPKTEQIARKFTWCQWDNINQQLFYLHYRSDGHGNRQHLMTCLQFFNDAAHDHVLDVPLNFPVASKSGRYYANIPLHNGIPDTSVNACVLTHSSGTFCFCYQYHVSTSDRRTKSSPLPRTSPLQRTSPQHHSSGYQNSPTGSDGDTTDVNYYICMVHHAKTIHGCVSSIPENVVKKAVLHFSWLGDLVMVMLPGYFVHLLNVSMEFEPCNHILLHNKSYADGISSSVEVSGKDADSSSRFTDASWDSGATLPVMSLMTEHLVFSSNYSLLGKESGSHILERNTGEIYKIHINVSSLIQAFTHCHMSMMRTSLLHYVILRLRDITLLKQLFLVLCNDIPSPEVPALMTEFLIGMTYSGMRRQLDREVLRLLPFTSTEPFRGQFDKGVDGERIARVSYSQIHSVNIGTKSAKERQQRRGNVGDDWLDNLRRHLHWMQICKSRRFTLDTVKKTFKLIQEAEETNLQSKEDENFLSQIRMNRSKSSTVQLGQCKSYVLSYVYTEDYIHYLNRRDTYTVGNYGNKTDSVLGTAPGFLQGSTVTLSSETMMSLTKDILVKHLTAYLNKEGKVKANAVAKEYVICQQTQSRLLCHLLWTLRGQHLQDSSSVELRNLSGKASLDEYELFQLLERYILVTGDVMFPIPSGFPSYFTSVGFRCLNIRMFMQYIEQGVIQLTGDFMAQLLSELEDSKENVRLKQYVISKLPQTSAVECYRVWGHSTCNQYMAYQQVADVLDSSSSKSHSDSMSSERSEDSRRGTFTARSSSNNSYLDEVSFQPLNAFFCHLDKLDRRRSGIDRHSPLDFQHLEEIALYHTTHETDYNMGTVNF